MSEESSTPSNEQNAASEESQCEDTEKSQVNVAEKTTDTPTEKPTDTPTETANQSDGGTETTKKSKIPVKEIFEPGDLAKWEKSEAYRDLVGFITAINEAVKGKKITDPYPVSQTIEKLLVMLDKMSSWIDEIPPVDQPQRFGNKAFRDFFKRLKENAETLVREAIGDKFDDFIPEISVYLIESIGNDTRIDYGSGHELAFAAFLCCLFKIEALTEQDATAAALKVFERYLQFVRKLQTVYRMEPAGSHGVWSLDDFQFLPFLWGSSQLLGHRRILPKSFVNPDIYETFAKDYMFLGCIKYINQVLGKCPVVQHFLFGNLLSIKPAT